MSQNASKVDAPPANNITAPVGEAGNTPTSDIAHITGGSQAVVVQRDLFPGASSEVREFLRARATAAAVLASRALVYLPLPPAIASLVDDRFYAPALVHGRLCYQEEMYLELPDELGGRVLSPCVYRRDEVFCFIESNIMLRDRRLAVLLPLAWRVGFVVGWLSALAVAQPDEARAGMVVLAALVRPLWQSSCNPALPGPKKGRE